MPKSMPQPDYDSTKEYFSEYCRDQIEKIQLEMTRLDKRLKKVYNAQKLYEERFGGKIELGEE